MFGVNDNSSNQSLQSKETVTTSTESLLDSSLKDIRIKKDKVSTRSSSTLSSSMQSTTHSQLLVDIKQDEDKDVETERELDLILSTSHTIPSVVSPKQSSVPKCPYQQAAIQYAQIELQLRQQVKNTGDIAGLILEYSEGITVDIKGVKTSVVKVTNQQFQLLQISQSAITETKKIFSSGPGNQWWANEESGFRAGRHLECREQMVTGLRQSNYTYSPSEKVQMSLCSGGGVCENFAEVAAYKLFVEIFPQFSEKAKDWKVFMVLIGQPIEHNLIALVHKDDVEQIKQLESEMYVPREFEAPKYKVKPHPVLYKIITVDAWIKNPQALLLAHYFPQQINSLFGEINKDCTGIDTNSRWFTEYTSEQFKDVKGFETNGGGVFGSPDNYKQWNEWVQKTVNHYENNSSGLPSKHDKCMFNVKQPTGTPILYINEQYQPLIPLEDS